MDKQQLIKKITLLPDADQREMLDLLAKYELAQKRERVSTNFMDFVHAVWPNFISGRHHKIMAEKFERVARGELKRLIINMPPRHTKSEFASYLLPSWYLGLYPDRKIIQASHTSELSVGFGRKARNLVDSPTYKELFPRTSLRADSKAAGRWNTSEGGDYFAIGVGGAVTGKGADLLIIDDAHSEQDAVSGAHNAAVFNTTWEWFLTGPRQRLQPNAAIVIVMTRWSKIDLTGRILQHSMERDGDEWEVISFPAILPSGNPLWPEYWSLRELESLKKDLPVSRWQAQYQQEPTSEEGAIIKREWWQMWDSSRLPHFDSIIVSWDTAFEKSERSDYSACTVWGVFSGIEKPQPGVLPDKTAVIRVMLIDAVRGKFEFPELKTEAMKIWRRWKPDMMIVEAKAAGAPLIYELRAMGIPVQEYKPTRGAAGQRNDKIARVNACSDMFASKLVYALNTRWAEDVIEETAEFPYGAHDDYVDTVTQALLRVRQGGYLRTDHDEKEEEDQRPAVHEYY